MHSVASSIKWVNSNTKGFSRSVNRAGVESQSDGRSIVPYGVPGYQLQLGRAVIDRDAVFIWHRILTDIVFYRV